MEQKRLVFQLGTNNWQRPEEPGPGSGILHESHHVAMNKLSTTKCYSIYPSRFQKKADRDDVRILKLEHDIPICESAGPVSSYRWHTMTQEEFDNYKERLETAAYEYMNEIEKKEGRNFTLAIAHHTFLNPVVMKNVLMRREKEGKPSIPLCVFAHGTALKMFKHEISQEFPEEYPNRFHPFVRDHDTYSDHVKGVRCCFAVSNQQVDALVEVFPEFPREKVILVPCGINQEIFKPNPDDSLDAVLTSFSSAPYEGSREQPRQPKKGQFQRLVIFAGRLADWKRIDAVLFAAKQYTERIRKELGIEICTMLAGGGPVAAQKEYQDLANDELGLVDNVFFLGPQGQKELARLYNVASLGVFPSHNEPFGMVLIECMGCGTPVLGAKSGGPVDYVSKDVGFLLDEMGLERETVRGKFADLMAEKVFAAVKDDWKSKMTESCVSLITKKYSVINQVDGMLLNAEKTCSLE